MRLRFICIAAVMADKHARRYNFNSFFFFIVSHTDNDILSQWNSDRICIKMEFEKKSDPKYENESFHLKSKT